VNWNEITSVEVLNREIITCQSIAMNKVTPKRTVRLRRESDMINYRIEEMKKKRDRVMKKG